MPDTEHPHRERLPFAPERSAATAHLPQGAPTRAWRRFDRVVLVATLLGLLVPWALLLAGLRPHPIENRPLARMPIVTASGLLDGSWFRGVDAFIADNVFVRPYAIRVRGEAYWLSGGTGNPQVLRGRDGWLFTRGEFEPACTFSAGQVVAAMDAAAASIGTKLTLRFVAIPDKRDIYPEKVLEDPFPAPCSETGRPALRAGLAALGAMGVDGWTALEQARVTQPETPLYFAQDSHWTPLGAVQVIRSLVTSIDPALWNEADIVLGGSARRSDELAAQMGLRRSETTTGVTVRPAMTVHQTDVPVAVAIHNARAIFRTTTGGPEPVAPGRTLILYDSFFGIDVGLVAPFFANATWVHVGDMGNHPELARILGPFDTVIVERVERGIYGADLGTMLSGLQR